MSSDWLPAITGLVGALVGAAAGIGGSTIGPLVAARQSQRGWLRDKRAVVYEQYAQALQSVADVVLYDDALNYRLGNEMQHEYLTAVDALNKATASFGIYASLDMRSQSEKIRFALQRWAEGDWVPVTDMTLEERESQRRSGGVRVVQADPLADDYPWDRIEAAEVEVMAHIDSILLKIRAELGAT